MQKSNGISFAQALSNLTINATEGIRIKDWNEDVIIKLQKPDENSKMSASFLYVESRFGNVPWLPTQIEILSDNWECRSNTKSLS